MASTSSAFPQTMEQVPLCILSLPIEVLIFILDHSSPRDIIRCQMTCRTMRNLVKGSAHIQYRIRLFEAGMVEGAMGDLSYDDCLRILRQRERAWHGLRWRKRVDFDFPDALPESDCGRIQLDNGVLYALERGEDNICCVVHTILPSSEDSDPRSSLHWEVHSIEVPAEDFYVDVSQDLLVLLEFVYSVPFSYTIHLRTLSTSLPHPHASHPILERQMSSSIRLFDIEVLKIQCAGDHIGVGLTSGATSEVFDFWNWRTGSKIDIPSPSIARWSSFCFLCNNTILLSTVSKRTRQSLNTLQVYIISSDNSVRHAVSYDLPSPKPPSFFQDVSIVNLQPLRRVHTTASQKQIFHSDPNQSIIVLCLSLVRQDQLREDYILVVDAAVLISDAHVQFSSDSSRMPTFVPWDDWGTTATRMIPQDVFIERPVVYGARYAVFSGFHVGGRRALALYKFIALPRLNHLEEKEERRNGSKVITVTEESVIQSPLFAHPVHTSLPYQMVLSGPKFDWEEFVMDEERIVGRQRRADILIM